MPLLLWQDSLRCRRPVAQRRVRPLRVVFFAPPLRQNLCLLQRVEDLAVQELIAQLPVETLTVAVLPWTPRFDVQRPGAHFPSHFRNSSAINSGPLSERICSGIPRTNITSASVSITRKLPKRRATRNAKHSRVYSSITTKMRSARPSCVIAFTKS